MAHPSSRPLTPPCSAIDTSINLRSTSSYSTGGTFSVTAHTQNRPIEMRFDEQPTDSVLVLDADERIVMMNRVLRTVARLGDDTAGKPLIEAIRSAALKEALDAARILLAPVVKRQREKVEKAAAEKAGGGKGKNKKPMNINIPLHGPRVEIVLAWLGAVYLPELDAVA